MKFAYLLGYFAFPALVTLWGFIAALRREGLGGNVLVVQIESAFFYAAPHLAWGGFCALTRPAIWVQHGGYVLSTFSLAVISAMAFLVHDPSGLPYQWLLYFPLAGFLLFALVLTWMVAGRPRAEA